eukprot:CAMPEP_0117516608 /NCGR_PEP_ID=MMETSP0784-20121206/31182_1 /TAXON_ID=39447 /ORGANISM="" /LENGTH=40 /DNA_ID= /DNA_START= /DNA_END= /DNA_ORIENTATION=
MIIALLRTTPTSFLSVDYVVAEAAPPSPMHIAMAPGLAFM